MPARGLAQGGDVSAFVALASDPAGFGAKLAELTERTQRAEAAEAKADALRTRVIAREKNVVEREEHAAKTTAETNQRRATLEADETALAERAVEVEKREAAAKEMEAMLVQRNADIEDKINNALRSVGKLILDGLDVSYEEKLKETKP